ncbi:hypothetical protein [Iodidimonas sp. SYSU 1G8]|uniref:hypothetical protein n=1 Tax=Iodidimonas sp. SYSU 1G8 TaxID=3133967 RepID=UPI0031FF14D7
MSDLVTFDYQAPADLFLRSIGARGKQLAYKRFDSAASAIQFVVEGRQAYALTTLEVGEDRFEKADIERLYEAGDYPLARKAAAR